MSGLALFPGRDFLDPSESPTRESSCLSWYSTATWTQHRFLRLPSLKPGSTVRVWCHTHVILVLSCLGWTKFPFLKDVNQIFVLLWFLLISLRLRLFPDIRRARPCILQPAAWKNQWLLMRRLPGNIHHTQLPCRYHMRLTGTERMETEA